MTISPAKAITSDVPVPADYDGDGTVDEAIWQPASGLWRITPSSSGHPVEEQWGQVGDLPVPAAYDGKFDLAVLRPADGLLYARPFSGGPGWQRPWGGTGGTPPPEDHPGMSAVISALDGLASRLSQAGRYAEAAEPARHARDVARRLATADPGAFKPLVAFRSVMLGAHAVNAKLFDEAIAATTEGADVYRAIGDRPQLAWALENLAMRYSAAGRYPEAVPPARESRDIHRGLAQADPAQRAGWAHAAVMLGAHAVNAKLFDEAIAATTEGADIYRAIPDRPQLAWALENLAMRYSAAGRYPEAVPPAKESRDIHRGLAGDNATHQVSWGHAAVMLGAHAVNAKLFDEAIEATREGVQVFRRIDDRPRLAWALDNLAMRYSGAGQYDEAVRPARECRDIYRKLAEADAAHKPSWGTSAVMLGAHASNAKLPDEAIAATQEGVAVFRELDNRPSLAWALDNLSIRFAGAGRTAEAVAPQRECRDIYRKLTEAEGGAGHRPSWAYAAFILAHRLIAADRRGEALNAALEAVRLYELLVRLDPARFTASLEAAKQLLASLQGLVQPGALIAAVTAPATTTPGGAVQVTVALKPDAEAGTRVTINGLAGLDVRLQASPKPGVWRVPVTATAETLREERVLLIEIAGAPEVPLLDIAQNPFNPLAVFVRAVEIDDANPVLRQGDSFRWQIGSAGYTTSEPVFGGELAADVDHARAWTPIPVRLDVTHSDGTSLSVERTLVLGSSYRVLRDELAQIRPPVRTDGQAVQLADRDSRYRGVFTVTNLEPVEIGFDRRRIEWTADDDEPAPFGPEETIDVTVLPGASVPVDVVLDRSQGHGAHGAIVHLFGKTPDGTAVHTSAAFSLVRPPRAQLTEHPGFLFTEAGSGDWRERFAAIVNDRPAAPVSVRVEDSGAVKVLAPRGLTQENLWNLRYAARVARNGEDRTVAGRGWHSGLEVTPLAAPGPVVQDGPCDPDDLPGEIPADFACQFTGDYHHDVIPPRIANARKGDLILVPGGNGVIGGLLSQVSPAQRYAHCGIMTRNHTEISHSTASEEWLSKGHPRGVHPVGAEQKAPTDGFEPDSARFQWPGGITQSVEEAYGVDADEAKFTDAENKKYKISAFNLVDSAVLDGRWQIIEPMVIKPHPLAEQADPTIRQRLHKVADEARSLCVTPQDTREGRQSKVHYRFYCYTDSAVAVRPGPGGVIGPAPDDAGWAAGTLPTQCASFLWLAARRAGIKLEGPDVITKQTDLELTDLQSGAQTDEQTLDGLYFYGEEERRRAARWFVPFLEEKIFRTARDEDNSWLEVSFNELFSDMGDDCANQLANTFAFDWADGDSKNSDRWENPGPGRAVSPDNLLLWDRPEETGFGLWGYAEPLVHHRARLEPVPVTKWRKTDGPALLKGKVTFNGEPVAGAQVNVGSVVFTDSQGRFEMDIHEGRYLVKASRFISREVGIAAGEVDFTAQAGKVYTIEVALEPPPERYRLVQIEARIEMRDDEFSANPFEDDPDEYFHDRKYWELRVDPVNPVDGTGYKNGWGGELRVDATINAKFDPGDLSVELEIFGTLFEGDNDQTTDYGGMGSAKFVIPAGAAGVVKDKFGRDLKLLIWNSQDDSPDDRIEFFLTVTNRAQL